MVNDPTSSPTHAQLCGQTTTVAAPSVAAADPHAVIVIRPHLLVERSLSLFSVTRFALPPASKKYKRWFIPTKGRSSSLIS